MQLANADFFCFHPVLFIIEDVTLFNSLASTETYNFMNKRLKRLFTLYHFIYLRVDIGYMIIFNVNYVSLTTNTFKNIQQQ